MGEKNSRPLGGGTGAQPTAARSGVACAAAAAHVVRRPGARQRATDAVVGGAAQALGGRGTSLEEGGSGTVEYSAEKAVRHFNGFKPTPLNDQYFGGG